MDTTPDPARRDAATGPSRIEDYGFVGDGRSGALVGRDGSVDWLCWPRFDSDACFAALLGDARNGRWRIAPAGAGVTATRRYRGETLVLETLFEGPDGSVAVIDFMPADGGPALVRIVEGRTGRVPMRLDLTLRFDYGSAVPWVTRLPEGGGITAIAGPHRATLRTPVPMKGENRSTVAEFAVAAGERVPFVLSYGPSHRAAPEPADAEAALAATEVAWREWAGRCTYRGRYRAPVLRSLLTLKAMIFAETGGIVAAPTTSLPERLGGSRNWDYRYCWLRDATLTLIAMMGGGYYDEARAWRDWLQRAVAGSPEEMQIMYGLAGERRLAEWEVPWLAGYEGARPVRIGNAAAGQRQLDVYGEVMGALSLARRGGIAGAGHAWAQQKTMLACLERIWDEPDEGIWETRGGQRHFTFSKVSAWAAFDRGIRDAEDFGLDAPLARWRATREEIHATVCREGFDPARDSFTQSFGDPALDASLLLLPGIGFLPVDDPRIAGTIAAIERELLVDGFVLRYRTHEVGDGLPPGEGVFLACSFWLVGVWHLQGRDDEAAALFERLLALSNDLGLLSEEYDVDARRLVGNFPQAFSHLALVVAALSLEGQRPAAWDRARTGDER